MSDHHLNKFLKFIVKLNQLTQDGQIRWSETSYGDSLAVNPSPGTPVYVARHGGKSLRIYEERQAKDMFDIFSLPKPSGSKKRLIKLEFVGDQGEALWEFPFESSDSLRDLLSSVKYQVYGVDEFLDSFLTPAE